VTTQVMEAAQSVRVEELEHANAMLLADLEQASSALAETETLQNSLFVDYAKLEEECVGLRTAVDTLEHEKTEAMN
jgi:hypothetical protein